MEQTRVWANPIETDRLREVWRFCGYVLTPLLVSGKTTLPLPFGFLQVRSPSEKSRADLGRAHFWHLQWESEAVLMETEL